MTVLQEAIIFASALGAGFVNALAGGGTLITFPTLLAIGISPVAANVTNTVALVPGTIGGMYAQRKEFQSQRRLLVKLIPVAVSGGIVGGLLILRTSETTFKVIIPYLILIATLILATQAKIRKWVMSQAGHANSGDWALVSVVFGAAVYGGYFGAGLGVILMAVLGLVTKENMTSVNFLKQALAFATNMAAAIYFAFSSKVDWKVAFIMIFGSLMGGRVGGHLAGKIKPELLRWVVVFAGLTASIVYFVKS